MSQKNKKESLIKKSVSSLFFISIYFTKRVFSSENEKFSPIMLSIEHLPLSINPLLYSPLEVAQPLTNPSTISKLPSAIYTYNQWNKHMKHMILLRYRAIVTESLLDEHGITISKRKLDSLDLERILLLHEGEKNERTIAKRGKYISLDIAFPYSCSWKHRIEVYKSFPKTVVGYTVASLVDSLSLLSVQNLRLHRRRHL